MPTRDQVDHVVPEQPDPAEIRRELAAILESSVFRASKRCHNFLGYVVTKALDGDGESLKERTLAIDVFGRKANADLADDSIVRVGAREVRKRLAQYYVTVGANDTIRIDLPAGSYVPAFHSHAANVVEPAAPALLPVPDPEPTAAAGLPAKRSSSLRFWLLTGLAVLAATLPIVFWQVRHAGPPEFEAFWGPAFAQKAPLLLALAHPLVYHPSSRLLRLDEEKNGASAVPFQSPIRLPKEPMTSADLIPVFDQYVGFGDMVASSRLAILFAQRGHAIRLRSASKVDFADMRDSASVLIGAYSNRWTRELAATLRYRFAECQMKPCIVDSQAGKAWTLGGKTENGRSAEDYILLCRMTHAQTGGFVVIGAGLTQYGTEEAGRILADPAALAPILRKLGSSWESRNLELILYSKVVGDTPTPPELVASYIW